MIDGAASHQFHIAFYFTKCLSTIAVIDGSGDAVGWEYDAMAEVATRLNATIVYENISWDAMIPAVSEGQFDLGMTGITIREDRMEVVDFSDKYMTSEMVM